MLIRVIEIALVFLALVVLMFQVLLPAYMGRRLFPMFRKSAEVEQKIVDVKEELYVDELKEELQHLNQKHNSKE